MVLECELTFEINSNVISLRTTNFVIFFLLGHKPKQTLLNRTIKVTNTQTISCLVEEKIILNY